MDTIRWDYYPRVARTAHARDWLLLLAQLQKAPKTIDAYARGLDDLIDFFTRSNFPLIEAHQGHIATYLNDLHQRVSARPTRRSQPIKCGLANATIQQRLTAARLWYDYLILHNRRRDQVNPVGRGSYSHGKPLTGSPKRALLPRYRQQPWIPGDDEWDHLLSIVLREESLRNQLMVLLAYEGALRRSELVALGVADIDWPQRIITIRAEITKNKRQRLMFYGDATQELLVAYMAHRQTLLAGTKQLRSGPLFVSESKRNPGHSLSVDMWNKIVQRLAKRAGLPQFTTHTFRHLRLTDYARAKLELYEIALLAGHKHLESTQLYINLSGGDLGERVRAATQHINERLRQKVAATNQG